jgi:hypothetical protein
MNWLWPALAVEDSIPRETDLAAADAVDLAAAIIDGPAWLREARFSSISYGILFARADDPQPMRIHRRELELSTGCHPDRLRSGDAAVRWMFFTQVLRDLEDVGKKYGLGSPPLRTSPHDASALVHAQLPLAGSGHADVSAEMAAMEDDEVLVAVPSELPDEDRAAAEARLTRTEEAVSRLLGPSRAGSTSGEAYVWAFPLPK